MRDLTGQFEANRPTGAGDEDGPPLDVRSGVGSFDDGIPPEQVGNFHLPQTAHADVPAEQLEHAGNGSRHHTGAAAILGHGAYDAPGRLRHGDDDLVDPHRLRDVL